MAQPTRRRTRATANSSPLVELKAEPRRKITRTKTKRTARVAEAELQPEPEREPAAVQTVRSEEISSSTPPFSFGEERLSVASFLSNPPSVLRDIYDLVKRLQAEVEELKQANAQPADPAPEAVIYTLQDEAAPAVRASPVKPSPTKPSTPKASPAKPAPVAEEDRSEALELLRLADQKREQNMALSRIDVRPVALSPPKLSPVHAASQPPSTPRTNGTPPPPVTPQSSNSFLGNMWSTLKSSVWSTPKPKSARSSTRANTPVASAASTPIAQPVIGDLTMALTPTPTPVGENRGNSKVKRTSSRRERAAIIKNVAASVPDPAEEELATKWAEKVLMQLLQESSTPSGDKRKRLEDGMTGMTYGDLNHFNSKPWKPAASSFGLDDDLMDHVDNTPDEPAPMWAILEHLRIEQQWKGKHPGQEHEASPPSAKKRKISTGANDNVASPKQSPLPLDHARSPFYNSGGKSTSLRDLHPRSCLDRPDTSPDNNIFKQSQKTGAQQDDAVPFPTSFSVPDDTDSDEDFDEEPIANGSTTWTQPPPPAPVMPHAELPGSLDTASPIPSVEGNLVASPTTALVEAQRAKLLKFTPAKPSNLSHMSKPSPSLRSDAGNETMLADTPVSLFKTKASGTAVPNIFQSANATNGTVLFQNKTVENDATPAQDKRLSNGSSTVQDKSLSNGNSIFQNKGQSNGNSIFQDKSLSNGNSIFQNKNQSNGNSIFQNKNLSNGTSIFQSKDAGSNASPFESKGIDNGASPSQTKSLSNVTFASQSAYTTLDLSEYNLTPPDAESLDLPSDIEAELENFVPSAEFQAQLDAIKNWSDPILVDSDDEDEH